MIILYVYLNSDFTKAQPVQTEKRTLIRVPLGVRNRLWNAGGGVPYKIIFQKHSPFRQKKDTHKSVFRH